MNSTEQFLAELRQVGRVDSRGTFTVSPLREFKGLRLFEDTSQVLLRLVQAAVSAEAAHLAIQLQVKNVELAFNPCQPVRVSDLVLQLMNPARRWQPLVFGLRGALEVGFSRVEVKTWDAEGLETLVLTPGKAEHRREPEIELNSHGVRITLKRRAGWSFRSLRERGQEHFALCHRCRFLPMLLSLDGRVVNEPDIFKTVDGRGRPDTELVIRSGLGPGALAGPIPRHDRTLPLHVLHEGLPETLLPVPGTQACRAVLGARSGRVLGQTEFAAVVWGVTLDSFYLHPPYPRGYICFMSAHHLNTDITGLRIVEDEKLQKFVEQVRSDLQKLIDRMPS